MVKGSPMRPDKLRMLREQLSPTPEMTTSVPQSAAEKIKAQASLIHNLLTKSSVSKNLSMAGAMATVATKLT